MTSPISTFAARLSEIVQSWQAAEGVIYTKITYGEDIWRVHYVHLTKKGVVKDAGYGGLQDRHTSRIIQDIIDLQTQTRIRIQQVVLFQGYHKMLIWYGDSSRCTLFYSHIPEEQAKEAAV